LAARRDQKVIRMEDFEEAKDKVTMGKARKSRVINEEENRLTAYHEVGHVLCSLFQDKVEPVHKVTIIPRGFTGGATHYLLTDKSNYSRNYLEQHLAGLMGGRAAEEIVFGELTTGAGNDIQRATDLAKKMVCNWGMSERIGPMTVGRSRRGILGKNHPALLLQRGHRAIAMPRLQPHRARPKRSKESRPRTARADAMSDACWIPRPRAERYLAIELERDRNTASWWRKARASDGNAPGKREEPETPRKRSLCRSRRPEEDPPTEIPRGRPPQTTRPNPKTPRGTGGALMSWN
jgi:hypothetical protein